MIGKPSNFNYRIQRQLGAKETIGQPMTGPRHLDYYGSSQLYGSFEHSSISDNTCTRDLSNFSVWNNCPIKKNPF